jgi:hypothetical protein
MMSTLTGPEGAAKSFPEKLEKDISKILSGFQIPKGKDALMHELLEYITARDDA